MFKTRKNRRFNYKPIYFDPDKEEREKKRKRLAFQREGQIMRNNAKNWDRIPFSELERQGKRRIWFLIALIGGMLTLFYLFFDRIDLIVEALTK